MVAVPMPARSGEVLGVVVLHTVAPARVRRGRAQLPRAHRVARGGRDRERAPLRGGAPARRRAHEPRRAQPADRRGRRARGALPRGDRRACAGCWAATPASCGCATARTASWSWWPLDPPRRAARAARRVARRAARRPRGGRRRSSRCARGVRSVPAPEDQELLQAVANQAALALRNAELIERLTAENLVRDLFEALDDGRARHRRGPRARRRAATSTAPTSSSTPDRWRPATAARPWPEVAERVETRLRTLEAGALVDRGPRRAARPAPAAGRRAGRRRRGACASSARERGRRHRHERRAPRRRRRAAEPAPGAGRRQHRAGAHARAAARSPTTSWAPTATSCTSRSTRRRTIGCARRWSACSTTTSAARRSCSGRSSSTSPTGAVGTTTARKLFIHANTLRQRLERIEKLTELDLATEDLLSLELAVKLVRLRRAGGAESPPRS